VEKDGTGVLSHKLLNDKRNCSHCGLCLVVCPTYRELLTETASPRGRLALINQAASGGLHISSNLMEQMYQCFGCMACDEICPAGAEPSGLVLELRNVREKTNPAVWKKLLFNGLVRKPDIMELASSPFRIYERIGLRRLVGLARKVNLLPDRISDWEAMLPNIPNRPLRQILPGAAEAKGESHYRVGFFLGCMQSLFFGRGSAATVRVLTRNGCTVLTPKDIQCCGMPSVSYGRQDLAKEQARHNISVFEHANVETILTDCATCGSMLKSYADLLEDDQIWSERAATFSRNVYDISEFLMKIPLVKPQHRIERRVTYHDPCHLRRGQGVWKEPRSLLGLVDGVDLIELVEADWCCGSGGSQLIGHYSLSRKVMQRKIDQLKNSGAEVIASGCPACQMQLNAGIKRRGLQVKVIHPVELLDWAYHGMRY